MAIKEYDSLEEMEDDFEDMMEQMQDEAMEIEEERRLLDAEPVLYVSWQFTVDCPKCDYTVDLADDDDGTLSVPVFNNRWGEVKGMEVTCTECDYKFKIHDVEPG